MAMYYYARKLQKSSKKASSKTASQTPITANGSIPGCSSVGTTTTASNSSTNSSASIGPSTSAAPGLNSKTNTVPTVTVNTVVAAPEALMGSGLMTQPLLSNLVDPSGNIQGILHPQISPNYAPSSVQSSSSSSNPNNMMAFPSTSAIYNGIFTNGGPIGKNKFSKALGNEWDMGLVYRDGNLISGTPDSLIHLIVPAEDYCPDRAYVFAFLLSSRLHFRPHEILGRVFHLTFSSDGCSLKFQLGGANAKVVSNLVRLLGEWTELFPYDFREERMMGHVRAITEKCVSIDPSVQKEVSILLSTLLARLTALEKYENYVQKENGSHRKGGKRAPKLTSALAICPDSNLLAEQLTHIELERLGHIGAEEFVQVFVKEANGSNCDNGGQSLNSKEGKKTRNVEIYAKWYNQLCAIVATDVVKIAKKKSRVETIEYWIQVARECFSIGNFNSLMAIVTGLNAPSVTRLRKTWAKVDCELLTSLEQHMDPSSNFTSYRALLKSAALRSSGTSEPKPKIVIPFFSLLIKDLNSLNEACATKLSNGHLNFERFWQLALKVSEIISWQQVTCPFPKVPTIISSIQAFPVQQPRDQMLSSYENEPPDTSDEKDKWKRLAANLEKVGNEDELHWNDGDTNSLLPIDNSVDETNDALLLLHLASNEPRLFSKDKNWVPPDGADEDGSSNSEKGKS